MAKSRSHDEEEMAARAAEALLDGDELARRRAQLMRAGPPGRRAAGRLALGRGALVIAGEVGYGSMTVEGLIERVGSNRAGFYAAFADKEACFSWAYLAGLEALAGRLLGSCRKEDGWAAGMRAALGRLASFLDAEPEVARGLIARPGEAGLAVAAKREEVVGRLSHAVDRARRETVESRHPVPPFTARFILGAIEAAVLKFLAAPQGRSFAEEVPGLLWLVVDLYLGPEAARAAVRALEAG